MKVEQVERGLGKDGLWWYIRMDNGAVFIKRAGVQRATDTSLSDTEELICALCEKIEEQARG